MGRSRSPALKIRRIPVKNEARLVLPSTILRAPSLSRRVHSSMINRKSLQSSTIQSLAHSRNYLNSIHLPTSAAPRNNARAYVPVMFLYVRRRCKKHRIVRYASRCKPHASHLPSLPARFAGVFYNRRCLSHAWQPQEHLLSGTFSSSGTSQPRSSLHRRLHQLGYGIGILAGPRWDAAAAIASPQLCT
ncbi:hypothetical protein B0H12DRAFT_2124 [Mycena haematopus]|nr:hypothetical protein B0H12DRAFT_2124 [Mycena haematopus]